MDYHHLEAAFSGKGGSPAGLLGYLNLSTGKPNPRWQQQLNEAYGILQEQGGQAPRNAPWQELIGWLEDALRRLHEEDAPGFGEVTQAKEVLQAVREVLKGYREYHADLLAHLSDAELFQPFFLVRVFEAILAERALENSEPLVARVITRLNDFVGHRPVALFETRPEGEPYPHEKHRPVPVWIAGAGAACGPWREVLEKTLELLGETGSAILADAQFDRDALEEIALDMRAYDHLHPANRRTNYVFGEWDPHHLDTRGRFCRYVIRKVVLEALMDRVEQMSQHSRSEAIWEGAAVLAGTILMASGVSGSTPSAHDSSTSLASLIPRIARYRDAFYQELLTRMEGTHAERIRQEIATTGQPFGAARQHLNATLARLRAEQMQYAFLARVYAEMGYPDASKAAAERIPAVSARMLSSIHSSLTSAGIDLEHGRVASVVGHLRNIDELIHRAIDCGAVADPWNILGFDGLFPLSPAQEDAVHDHRIAQLIEVMERLFSLHTRAICEAVCAEDGDARSHVNELQGTLDSLAQWWDRFAAHEVGDYSHVHGAEAVSSARQLATVLEAWRAQGEQDSSQGSDLAFWRDQLNQLNSPKSFSLIVDALLRRQKYRAAMGLLISWLGQAEQVPLEEGIYSFHTLALRWMLGLTQSECGMRNAECGMKDREADDKPPASSNPHSAFRIPHSAELVCRFLAYLEANAEEYWSVPTLEFAADSSGEKEEDLYEAAYEGMTYRDTTDSTEGEVVGGQGPVGEFPLEQEAERIEARLRFLSTLARLWLVAARFLRGPGKGDVKQDPDTPDDVASIMADCKREALAKYEALTRLLDAIHEQELPPSDGDESSLVDYDRRRGIKDHLLMAGVGTTIDMAMAIRWLALPGEGEEHPELQHAPKEIVHAHAGELDQAMFEGNRTRVLELLPRFTRAFRNHPLLYIRLEEGGSPRQILRVRLAQTTLRNLLVNLPRLGLVRETYQLLRTAREMEQAQPLPGRGITEFNHFFQAALQSVVEWVVESASEWFSPGEENGGVPTPPPGEFDLRIANLLEEMIQPFAELWLEHSQSLQLSVLEPVLKDGLRNLGAPPTNPSAWALLTRFIQTYGADLFHPRFLALGNLRGILHQGVEVFLNHLEANDDPLKPNKLVEEIGRLDRGQVSQNLRVILQAIVENYEEYKDYNATTTQSDYGGNLHLLLEFLRLKVGYERTAWQLRPLMLVHEVLARQGTPTAARRWEESLATHTRQPAQAYLDQLVALEQQSSIRLMTVRHRLEERFVKPLSLDRLCALVEPCMDASFDRGLRIAECGLEDKAEEGIPPATALNPPSAVRNPQSKEDPFERFQEEMTNFTSSPTGVGLDVPGWLRRLEMEVRRVQAMHTSLGVLAETFFKVPRIRLKYEEMRAQVFPETLPPPREV